MYRFNGLPDDVVARRCSQLWAGCEPDACRAAGVVFADAVNAMEGVRRSEAPLG